MVLGGMDKGKRTKVKAKNLLEELGFLVHKRIELSMVVHDTSIFGVFDLVALRDGCLSFIRVVNGEAGGVLDEVFDVLDGVVGSFDCGCVRFEVWVKVDYAGWMVYRLVGGEWELLVDESSVTCFMGDLVRAEYC